MSNALAELLGGSSTSQRTLSLLEKTRIDWPLNGRAWQLPQDDKLSHRVRLRRTITQLKEWGIKVSGIEQAHREDDAVITFSGSFDGSGSIKEYYLKVVCSDDQYLEQLQMALQAEGWPAIIDFNNQLWVNLEPISEEEAEWLELGIDKNRDNASLTSPITPARASQWIEASPQLKTHGRIRQAEDGPLEPSQITPWLELTYKEESVGDFVFARKPALIDKWVAAGFTAASAEPWVTVMSELSDFDYAKQWMDRGCTAEDAPLWINALPYSHDPSAADELIAKGLKLKHVKRLAAADVSGWQLGRMLNMSMSISETVAWLESGITSRWELNAWKTIGETGSRTLRWQKAARKGGLVGDLSAEQAEKWLTVGRSIDDAEPWIKLHRAFIDLELVRAWEAEGYSAKEAAAWAKAGVPKLDDVKLWQEMGAPFDDSEVVAGLAAQGVKPEQALMVLEVSKQSNNCN